MTIKRQQIMDAVAARMALILTGSGYYSDLGLNVIESRPQLILPDGSIGRVPVEPSECPCILIRDPLDTITLIDLDENEEHELDLEFEARHEGGAITDSDLRKMEQDIRTAIGLDPTWGGLTRGTTLRSGEKILLQANKIIGGLLVKGSAIFYTAAFSEE